MRITKIIVTSLIFALFLLIQSCHGFSDFENSFGLPESMSLSYDDNTVHIEDVISLHDGSGSPTRSKVDIACICDEVNDTLLYVYNKPNGGWVMYSTDTRVPCIIAESESGSFSDLMHNESVNFWIKSIALDMKLIRSLDDDYLNFSSTEIAANKLFWKKGDAGINENSNIFRAVDKNPPPLRPFPTGHYEYSHTDYFTETYDSISRLTKTDWSQWEPFNMYCPFKTDGSGERAPAGCVPIAGAQMLYFLHHKFGVPEKAPSKAYCNGDVSGDYSSYDWAQTDFTSEIWDRMQFDDKAAAPLIAAVGKSMLTVYGNEQSASVFRYLIPRIFMKYKISCGFGDYDENVVKENLLKGMPVLVDAKTKTSNDAQKSQHSFIVDRYKRKKIKYEIHYRWIYDFVPENTPIPMVSDSVIYGEKTPEIDMIGMNWGSGFVINWLSGWYTLTGDWIIHSDDGDYNFNIDRKMIYIKSVPALNEN